MAEVPWSTQLRWPHWDCRSAEGQNNLDRITLVGLHYSKACVSSRLAQHYTCLDSSIELFHNFGNSVVAVWNEQLHRISLRIKILEFCTLKADLHFLVNKHYKRKICFVWRSRQGKHKVCVFIIQGFLTSWFVTSCKIYIVLWLDNFAHFSVYIDNVRKSWKILLPARVNINQTPSWKLWGPHLIVLI